jgi:DNA-binding transcriptional MerR regulator
MTATTAAPLYTIGQVADMTGTPIKTIRYYAEIGLLPPATTTPARYRLYSAAEIWRLELVRTLRHVGFSLDEIRQVLTGDLDVAAAIAWQIEALDVQIGQLTRLRDLLRQAQATQPAGERSLAYLHDLGAALTRGAEERHRLLAAKLGAALGGEAIPPTWIERMLQDARQRLPAEPTANQAAAWAELLALLDDPDFAAGLRAHAAPFWETVRQRQVDGAWWHAALAEINERALAALAAHAAPETSAVQALARDWAALFARALGRPCDDAFLRDFAARAPQFVDERARRVQELLERAGWRGADGEPSQIQAQQLVLDGLLALVAQHSPPP